MGDKAGKRVGTRRVVREAAVRLETAATLLRELSTKPGVNTQEVSIFAEECQKTARLLRDTFGVVL